MDALADNVLLDRLHELPRDSAEHEAICAVLVTRYAGLVRSCVRPYRRSPEAAEDLQQVAYVGLLKAINNFDPNLGDNLTAYAIPTITGELKKYFRDKRWQIRVRRNVQELLLEMRTAEDELTQELGHAPGDGELARHLGVSEEDILQAREASQAFSAYSLDAPLSDGEDPAVLADVLGEDDNALAHAIDIDAVNAHLDELPTREQRILILRFYGNLTQTQIADKLGISQMHVSRLLDHALTFLRDRINSELD
jgi:RNA polymerase sigma-B factor